MKQLKNTIKLKFLSFFIVSSAPQKHIEISAVLNKYLEKLPLLTFITKMYIKYLQFHNTTKSLKYCEVFNLLKFSLGS